MRDDRRLMDTLDACIERLRAGEPLERILQDYPDDADRLRDLLQIAQTAEQINFSDPAVAAAQSSVWDQLNNRSPKDRRRFRLALPLTAVAAILVLGIVSLVALQLNFDQQAQMPLTGTNISELNSTNIAQAAATQTVERIILSPSMMPPPSATARPSITVTPTSTPLPTSTATSSPVAIVVTSVAGMAGGTATPFPPTVAPIVGEMTATARVIGSPTIEVEALLTSTALTNLLGPTEVVPTLLPPISSATPAIAGTPLAVLPSQMPPTVAPPQSSATPLPTQSVQLPALEPLNAGSIDDNASFDDYLLYRRNFLQRFPSFPYDVDVTMRQIITVTDSRGYPIANAVVRIFAEDRMVWQATTYADGRTLFFPNATIETRQSTEFQVMVTYANTFEAFLLDLRDGPDWTVVLPTATQNSRQSLKLDVLFLIDSTGSMADEIYELQTNVLRISDRIAALDVDTAFSYVTYRDAGDAYELQTFDFTSDVAAFQIDLSRLRADGGGDYPESLNRAFDTTVNAMSWRDDALKLVFLIADAAPHFRDQYRYDVTALVALEDGIKVFPLASSGLDQLGEYVFRQISQLTFAKFLFLTYEDSDPQQPGVQPGEPGDERPDLEAGEDPADFTVEQLDELILRLIVEEIRSVRSPVEQQ